MSTLRSWRNTGPKNDAGFDWRACCESLNIQHDINSTPLWSSSLPSANAWPSTVSVQQDSRCLPRGQKRGRKRPLRSARMTIMISKRPKCSAIISCFLLWKPITRCSCSHMYLLSSPSNRKQRRGTACSMLFNITSKFNGPIDRDFLYLPIISAYSESMTHLKTQLPKFNLLFKKCSSWTGRAKFQTRIVHSAVLLTHEYHPFHKSRPASLTETESGWEDYSIYLEC